MPTLFDVQGFGALSQWNGQLSSASAAQAYQSIAAAGSNSVELAPRIWTQTGTSTSVFADGTKTDSDASIAAAIHTAHADGLTVLLKPHLGGLDGTASYKLAPSDVAAFFASYKAEIAHLATIAQANGAEMLSIGNELGSLSGSAYTSYWTDIISAVRDVYHGTLTYAAATDEASKVGFWSQLDTIGVNAYPPLTASTAPTVADLVHAWNDVPVNPYYAAAFGYKSPVDFLHSLSEQYGKQVLLTEVGYRSLDGTLINPANWYATGTADVGEQADGYNAFLQTFSEAGGSWFKGVEFWQWDLNNAYSPTGYSPMGKPALDLVSQYFHGTGTVTGSATGTAPFTINGSAISDVIDLGHGDKIISTGLGNDAVRVRDGTNVIYAGPDSIAPLKTTTITLTGYGSLVNGVGAQVQVFIDGKAVSGLMEFKPAADPSGYQTFTITFDNPASVGSIDVSLMNATSGRALHLKDFSINGVSLVPSDTVNASAPGTFDLYVRSIHLDASTHPDVVYGAQTANDTVIGGSGNDTIYVGAGSNTIDGGGGSNTAVYSGNATDYDVVLDGTTFTITKHINGHVDHLSNVQFVKFADQTISIVPETAALAPSAPTAATGSHDVYLNGITGKSYTSEHQVIDVSGHTILIERFHTDGTLAFTQTVNADGSKTVSDYDASGVLKDTLVLHADGSFDQHTFDATGSITGETIRHADLTRDVFTYDIAGKSYVSEHAVLDASGHTALLERFYGDGTLAFSQIANADGSKVATDYDTSGLRKDVLTTHADGSFEQLTFDTSGALAGETIRHADLSRDVFTFDITGKSYASEHDVLDAAGHTTVIERFYDGGALAFTQVVNADGSKTVTNYGAAGFRKDMLTSHADGSYEQLKFSASGAVTSETDRHADFSRDVYTFGITGKGYTAQHDVIDAAGHRVQSQFANSDGSQTTSAYASGLTLTATSGTDIFNSFGGDTFVFTAGSGHDVINNFKAGDAPGHDVIRFDHASVSDPSQLTISTVGHDTVVGFGHGDSVTLTNVSGLTLHDFVVI